MAQDCATTADNGGRGDASGAEPIAARELVADGGGRQSKPKQRRVPPADAAWRKAKGGMRRRRSADADEELDKQRLMREQSKSAAARQQMTRQEWRNELRSDANERHERATRDEGQGGGAAEAATHGVSAAAMRLQQQATARWRVVGPIDPRRGMRFDNVRRRDGLWILKAMRRNSRLSLNCCRSSESIGKRVMVTGYLRYEKVRAGRQGPRPKPKVLHGRLSISPN
ncbi:hypothetical protein Scep_004112 [Stephania cephalantha]|uniref:Uncharacterized protein n=1 Tax=Stephania cephalantha TaxID=152367 RepID=A0AAP0PV43_9MAGN